MSPTRNNPQDPEIQAIALVMKALEPLESAAQDRVVSYVASRLGIAPSEKSRSSAGKGTDIAGESVEYEDLPTLLHAASPKTDFERTLVAGYFFQVVQGQAVLESQTLNAALKNLGHGSKNITHSLTSLITKKPALVMQTQKSGKTKQSRKKYKLTTAGVQAVKSMISGAPREDE